MLDAPDGHFVLQTDAPDPVMPGPGQALVQMRAAGLNYLDLAVWRGHFPGLRFPNVPVADGCGEVMSVGPGVQGLMPGDRVLLHPKPLWYAGAGTPQEVIPTRGVDLPGVLAQFVTTDARSLVVVPPHLSWAEAGGLPVAATTAWRALELAAIGPGRTVLLQGTGGVSVFALQLARARGARVIITSSSGEKLRRMRGLGADETLNYATMPDWVQAVRSLTGGEGVDLVIDSVGGENLNRSVGAVRHGGLVFVIGFLQDAQAPLALLPVIGNEVRLQGSNTGPVSDLAAACRAIAAHRIQPVIDRVFPVRDVAAAYAYLGSQAHTGKIALQLSPEDW